VATAVARAQAPATVEAEGDGQLTARRDAPLGGQAVLEGVMMRGVATWAVAVRRPPASPAANGHGPAGAAGHGPAATTPVVDGEDPLGEIEVTSFPLSSPLRRHRILRAPVVRGVVALGESLAIGFRALGISANAQLPPEEGATGEDGEAGEDGEDGEGGESREVAEGGEVRAGQGSPQEIPRAMWVGTAVVALVLAIGLFFLIPVGLTSLIKGSLGGSSVAFWAIEGVIRTAIFLAYMLALSRVRDLRRVFEYHGAEHKTISCYEAQLELTPANAQRFSRLHPRCGTSFLLVVMIVAIFVFAPLGLLPWYWLVATRILGVPLIAGISFEIIKFAGRNRSRPWVQALMWPGLKLQLLTTREPDLHQLAVAIAALRAVLEHETLGTLSAKDLVGVEVVA
jgi:uncharacterized protein YqhQ